MSSPSDIGRRNAIPVIYTSGTYYEVGFDVGRTFRGLIQEYVRSSRRIHGWFLPAYETEKGRAAYDSTLACLLQEYPHYVRELQGTADGAQVPFHHLMLLHMDEVVSKAAGVGPEVLGDTTTATTATNGCSSLSINTEAQVLLGHTEDSGKEVLNYVYIVSARIHEEPRGKLAARDEHFTAFCYAGQLPGFCMGYNQHGLVFSINVICPTKVLVGKAIRHFVCRELLSATSVEAAHHILRGTGTGCGDGFGVNLVFVRRDGDGEHLFQNAEVGPAEHGDESPVSIVTLSLGEHLLHTNKYLRLTGIEEAERAVRDSDHRHARAAHFPVPKNRSDLLQLLSETLFFREGSEHDQVRTLALGVFDFIKKTWSIWMRNPRDAEPLLELPLLFTWNT